MASKVLFYRGLYKNYDAATMTGAIYFATDTGEIWIDGKRYGNDNQQVVQDVALVDGNLVITYNTYTESVPDAVTIPVADIMANLSEATATSAGLMSAEDKAALDALKNNSAVDVEDSLTSNSSDKALSANQGKLLKEMIDAIPAYGIEKTAEGYKLVTEAGGDAQGEVISFSDLVVKSGEVIEVDGKSTIRLTLTNDDVIDIPAISLVDEYTPNDEYINITSDNKIGINVSALRANLGIPADLSAEVAELTAVIGNSESGLAKEVAEATTKIGALQSDLSNKVDVSAFNAVSGAVADNTTKLGVLESKVDVEKVSTAISNAVSSFKVKNLIAGDNINIEETIEPGTFKIGLGTIDASDIMYAEGVSVKSKLDTLSDVFESAGSGGLVGLTAGVGITVNTSMSTTMPTIGIKIKADSALSADEDGLDVIWKEFLN